jgi:hypothetical protein
VFDSGAQLEQLSLQLLPDVFNSEGTNETFDGRSDNKGEGAAAAAAVMHCASARITGVLKCLIVGSMFS